MLFLARAVFYLLSTTCEHGSSMLFILARAVFYLLSTTCEHGSSMLFILARAPLEKGAEFAFSRSPAKARTGCT